MALTILLVGWWSFFLNIIHDYRKLKYCQANISGILYRMIIEIDSWIVSEGISSKGMIEHVSELGNHRGWSLEPEMKEWFAKNNIDYSISTRWVDNKYRFFLSIAKDEDAMLVKMRW